MSGSGFEVIGWEDRPDELRDVITNRPSRLILENAQLQN